ncbi:putative zinc-type alcohol dehydrogenase-like protein [Amycolatopsis bartoniae]|uniref:alcohol dehydrogenase (NADP(+)) n=1 Tax=Amycolatopsis bartoniae TaxID=941986 RepID=A0A8H9IUY7_9PSEU|nr:NAD(P)-dependent alcohol dehydrogenase [Amycolatopsis bartoniae]MBB2937993.1 putative zinc-type alcohol dehydrogenase-like protein [Amycolatopsis bartoniae]TVT07566.1 NAD(P)-dependent alcohol dehydrogenase [Amycolatopsis bartoniae]GHF42176.1 NADP-dependent alcohol dehydrogenase [Amycolatopsis bartoniae]
MRTTTGWESTGRSTELRRVPLERRDLREDDLAVRVEYCGVCHSDLHSLHGLTGKPTEGLVPGHEFTGVVTAVGAGVTAFAPGDRVAVGTIVDSCGACAMCRAGQENYCYEGATSTYGTKDRVDGTVTKGGYSREYVLREKFAYRLPEGLDPAAAAPLLCAGITMWEPLKAAGIGAGSRVAIAGLGGLGHLGVKLAAALGAEVTVLSRTPGKAGDARALGATGLLDTTDETQLAGAAGRFDLVLDTISAPHDLAPLLRLLGLDGTLSVVGLPVEVPVQLRHLTYGRKKLTSSGTGGTRGTAEMLAFAAEHGITAEVELLPSARVEEALTRLERGDVRFRFVLDLSDLD